MGSRARGQTHVVVAVVFDMQGMLPVASYLKDVRVKARTSPCSEADQILAVKFRCCWISCRMKILTAILTKTEAGAPASEFAKIRQWP